MVGLASCFARGWLRFTRLGGDALDGFKECGGSDGSCMDMAEVCGGGRFEDVWLQQFRVSKDDVQLIVHVVKKPTDWG